MKKLNKEAPKFRTQGLLLMFISIICIVFMICGILAPHAANATDYTGPVNYNNTSTGVPGTLVSGDTVTSTGKPGVYINGVNARVTLPNVGVTANNYYGVYINGGASADITDGSRVNTIGDNAFGVLGFGSIANIRDSAVTTNGLGAHGVYARDNSTINVTNSDIRTLGGYNSTGSIGVVAWNNSRLNVTGGTISTALGKAHGGYAYNGSTLTADNVKITTSGDTAYGLYSGLNSALVVRSVDITTSGKDGYGLLAFNGSTASVADGKITTSGGAAPMGRMPIQTRRWTSRAVR